MSKNSKKHVTWASTAETVVDDDADGGERPTKRRKITSNEEDLEAEEVPFGLSEEDIVAMDAEALASDTQDPRQRRVDDKLTLEDIIYLLQTTPDSEPARAAARMEIERAYLLNGGVPINPTNPMPVDLEKFSSKELENIIKNITIFEARNKKDDIVSRALNIFCNASHIAGKVTKMNISNSHINAITSDQVLKESFVEVFLGRTTRVHPVLAFVISFLSHLSNILVRVSDGLVNKNVQQPGTHEVVGTGEGGQGQGQSGSSSSGSAKS